MGDRGALRLSDAVALGGGARLDQGLAEDRAWREERRRTVRRKLVRARRVRDLGRGCCVAAGLALSGYWLLIWLAVITRNAMDASAVTSTFTTLAALLLVAGVGLTAGARGYPRWLRARSNPDDFEAAADAVETEELRRAGPRVLPEPRCVERAARLAALRRKEATYSNLCLLFGAAGLLFGAFNLADSSFLASLGFQYLVPALLMFSMYMWLPIAAGGWALVRVKRHLLSWKLAAEETAVQPDGSPEQIPA